MFWPFQFSRRQPAPRQARPGRCNRRKEWFHPRVETLEDRTTPSTFVVDTPLDTGTAIPGAMSLRGAIDLANANPGADQIVFNDLVFHAGVTDTIVFAFGQLPEVTESLVIDGAIDGGAGRVILDAASRSRILHNNGSRLDLHNLVLRNGLVHEGCGGAVLNDNSGVLNLVNTDVTDSEASRGGGLCSEGGTVSVTGGTFRGNRAAAITIDGEGGAFRIFHGALTLTNATIRDNSSYFLGGAIRQVGGTLTIDGSTIGGNTSENGDGGGIYSGGSPNSTDVVIRGSTIENNSAPRWGGGVYQHRGSLTIQNCIIRGNSSFSAGGILSLENSLAIIDSTIENNSATQKGGGLYLHAALGQTESGDPFIIPIAIRGCTISGNTAAQGGGLFVSSALDFTLANSTVSGNSAASGGGLYASFAGRGQESNSSRITDVNFTNCTFSDNTAGDAAIVLKEHFLSLRSTIVANTTDATGAPQADLIRLDADAIIDAKRCLIENVDAATINGTNKFNQIGVDPRLGPLADNGGPTRTHALLPGSPCINAGYNPLRLGYDQRGQGFPRVLQGVADVGAFESNFAPPPKISISDVQMKEGHSGRIAILFTVSLSHASVQPVTVNFATANNTAKAGEDYEAASGTLTFAPGETTKTITVWILGDTKKESNETFYLNLSGANNASILDGQALGTILNDD